MYCGPILLNINPGPQQRENYLNLENWVINNEGKNFDKKKPHLYSYIESIFEALKNEKKDQVVNLLGHIGSGKTFNLIHILEYLCFFHAPEKKQIEFFDTIHKSIQIIHILGSIFRKNNIESSSCGMQIRIGFDEKYKICDFDLKANILDLTLPFSENGRSFSILHSIMTSASSNLKNFLELPEREISLNFFKKFSQHFDKETKDRFMLNDYEIWNRFHSLMNTFGFTKSEVIEILQLFSFILLCNEASIGKKKSKHGENYLLNKNPATKKLSKNFGMSEDDFIKFFGIHKNIEQTKNFLISIMRCTYNCIFEFVMEKVNLFLKDYFSPYIPKKPSKMHQFNDSFNINAQKINQREEESKEESIIKYISFIDIPGEVNDHTLGGLLTNLANECQNLFTAGNFMSIIEKLQTEHIEIKYFQPLHSFSVLQSLLSKEGILGYLSRKFTEKNFKSFNSKIKRKDFYKNCLKFVEEAEDDLTFDFKFSNKNVTYNYLSLYKEAKNCIISPELIKLFSQSKNSIIKDKIKYITQYPKNIHQLSVKILFNLFENLKGSSPYLIYFLHSNTSLKYFFDKHQLKDNDFKDKKISKDENWEIPKNETYELIYHSTVMPILYWNWHGYSDWMDVELFVSEFAEDFKKIQNYVSMTNKDKKIPSYGISAKNKDNQSEINLKKINPFESSEIILKVFCKSNLYLIGSQHILFKKGTLNQIRETFKNVIEAQEKALEARRGMNNSLLGTSKILTGARMNARNMMNHNRSTNRSLMDINTSLNKSNINSGGNKNSNENNKNIKTKTNNNSNNDNNNSKIKSKNFNISDFSANKNSTNKIPKNSFNNTNSSLKDNKINNKSIKTNSNSVTKIQGYGTSHISNSPNSKNRDIANNSIHSKNKVDKNSSIYAQINTEENYYLNMQEINNYSGGFSANKNENETFKKNNSHMKISQNNNNIFSNPKDEQEKEEEREKEKFICKRSMKEECRINFLQKVLDLDDKKANQEAKDELGLNLGGDLDSDFDNLDVNSKRVKINIKSFDDDEDYDLLVGGKYSIFHIIDPKKYQHHEFVGSVDITQATHLESEFDIYKNKNNIVIPKNKYFYSIKNLFDHTKIENYGIFDYSKVLPEIILIQKSYRKYKIIKKFMIWRYAIRCFLLIQRWLRGFIVRVKFREFKIMLKFVRKLQLFYRRRFEEKTKSAIKIQSIVRMKMSRIYYLDKLARREMHDESYEEEYANGTEETDNYEEVEPDIVYEEIEVEVSVDENGEEFESVDNLGVKDGIEIIDEKGNLIGISDRKSIMNIISDSKLINNQKGKNYLMMNRRISTINIVTPGKRSITTIEELNDLISINVEKKPKEKKIPKPKKTSQKKLKMDIDPHLPDGKGKKGFDEKIFRKKKIVKKIVRKIIYPKGVKLFEKEGAKGVLERAKKFKKVTRIESGYSRQLKRKKKIQGDYTEKELGNISQSKIDRKNLINESSIVGKKVFLNNMSRISILEPDKDKRLICDLLMRTEAVKGLDNSINYLNDNYGIIKKNLRDSTKKLNSNDKPKEKIEDRLLSYGEHSKIKRVEKKMEQMKIDASNYPFKPTITSISNNSRIEYSLINRSNIIDRSILYHQEKEEKREMLRNKYEKKDIDEELIFRPKINSLSKNINRKLDDLYNWKNKVDEKKEEKKRLNEIETDLNKGKKFVPNANSIMINKYNNYSNFKKNPNPNNSHSQNYTPSHNRSQDDIGLFENNDEIEFDLWPDLNKVYVKGDITTENTFANEFDKK